jgi:PAS domain S-box-containing protein
MGIRSMLTVGVHADAESPHCLMIQSSRAERRWAESYISRLPVLVRAFINALSRHRLEETRRLELRHADVLESVGAIIWRADARTFQTTFVSREAESILGYPIESWIKVPDFWRTHIHPDDRAWVESFSSRAVQERRNHDFEYRMAVANGRIVWLRNIVKVIVENGEAVALVGATVDITQRKQAEFEAAQLRHQLTHAGRVATMGHFAAALAHELNQPLGAVVSNAESALVFLEPEPPLLDRVRVILDDIIRDGKRAGEIVHRMRTFLQQRSFATQPLDLAALVNAVIGLARPLALSRQIDLRVDCEPRLPSYGDAVQIQQVLLNLIVNAVEAVGDQPPENRQIVVRGVRHGSSVELSVSDSGRGIPPDVMPHLFDPFFTTKADGLGMGLPISQAIIDAHGGRVDVENRPTGGAIVRVTLPAGGQRDQVR